MSIKHRARNYIVREEVPSRYCLISSNKDGWEGGERSLLWRRDYRGTSMLSTTKNCSTAECRQRRWRGILPS
jgi:hypothetical protein